MFVAMIAERLLESGLARQERTVKFASRMGGKNGKSINCQVVVSDSCEGTGPRVQLEPWHGPDGTVGTQHSTPISFANPGTPVAVIIAWTDAWLR